MTQMERRPRRQRCSYGFQIEGAKPTFCHIFEGAKATFCPLLLIEISIIEGAIAPSAPPVTTPLIELVFRISFLSQFW